MPDPSAPGVSEPFTFTPLDEARARGILAWRYEDEYAVYNLDVDAEDALAELLDRRSPYYAVSDAEGTLIGFFCFGAAAEVGGAREPALYGAERTLSVGLGLRPDLTGRGFGYRFLTAGLAFARTHFAPFAFRLFVLTFNQRAIRLYERAGFQHVRVLHVPSATGERAFLEMWRAA